MFNNPFKKRLGGFTLIEMIVVITLLGFIIPVIFTVVFGIIRQQLKIIRLTQIKEEGDFVLNNVATTIRNNVISIHTASPPTDVNQICDVVGSSAPMTFLYFLDKDANWLGFGLSNNEVASSSAGHSSPPTYLTSSKILISNFQISCQKSAAYSAPSVLLNFDICYNTGAGSCASTRPEETATLHYQTRVQLRNF